MTPDSELIALVAAGDADAYADLYLRHREAAQREANKLTRHNNDVEDLVSDAFARILLAIQHGGRLVHFRAYLLTTIRHAAYKLAADQRRIVTLPAGDDDNPAGIGSFEFGPDPAAMCDTEPIRCAFRSLPPRWRIAIWLSTIEGRPPAELASMLHLTPNGAAGLTYRARRGLLRILTTTCPATRPAGLKNPDPRVLRNHDAGSRP